MKKKILTLVVSFLYIGMSIAQDYKIGISLLQYQRYNSAKENFKAILQQNPTDAVALFWLTETFIKNKEADKAAEFLLAQGNAIKDNALIKISKAHILAAQNKKADAEKILVKNIFVDTTLNKDEMQCVALGRTYTDIAKYNLAASFFLRAHSLNPANAYTMVQLGQSRYKNSDGSGAYKYFTKALEIEPEFAAANFWIGILFKGKNNSNVFLPYFNKVLAKDSLYAPAWYELYRYAYYNDKTKSKGYYSKYLETADKTDKQEYQLLVLDYNNKKFSNVIANGIAMLADKEAGLPVEIYKYLAYSYYSTKNNELAYNNMIQYLDVQDSSKILASDNYLMAQFAARLVKKDSVALNIIATEYLRDTSNKNKYFYAAKLYNHYVRAKETYNLNLWKERLLPFKNYNKVDMYNVGLNWYDMNELGKADSIFADFTTRYPKAYEGIYMQGTIKAKLDSNYTEGLALPYFTKFIDSITIKGSPKYKTQIAQAYSYIGGYYLAKKDYTAALEYYQKLLVEKPKDSAVKNTVYKIKKYLKDVKNYKKEIDKNIK
jgi:tetratricopeptide (TPR) repeat protein